ncbi:MAG: alpha/beta hydrolase-fold protein, partial [Actinomycetota bacterium]|nr:alpha/beta hydrolase-fold protein [Actinomycetota bacterium]
MGRKNSGSVGGRMTSRRDFLRLAGGATGAASIGLFTSCRPETTTAGVTGETPEASEGRQEVGSAAGQGRLLARPAPVSPNAEVPTGLQPLGLGSGRDGLLYVPEGYGRKGEAPLALTLHGAGGNARGGISHLLDLADESGTILLAPESRGRTWDVLVGGYGPDVEFIDRALEQTFDRLAVNAEKLAVTGFSDGASYALSLGLTNGDFFTHVIAFSPGFAAPAGYRGKPSIFVSHGTHDEVLPIRQTSRQIVPELERKGYEVHYREFDGSHG